MTFELMKDTLKPCWKWKIMPEIRENVHIDWHDIRIGIWATISKNSNEQIIINFDICIMKIVKKKKYTQEIVPIERIRTAKMQSMLTSCEYTTQTHTNLYAFCHNWLTLAQKKCKCSWVRMCLRRKVSIFSSKNLVCQNRRIYKCILHVYKLCVRLRNQMHWIPSLCTLYCLLQTFRHTLSKGESERIINTKQHYIYEIFHFTQFFSPRYYY